MKLKFLLRTQHAASLLMVLLVFVGCRAQMPVATTSHERIETQMQPMVVGADTIELEYRYRPLRLSGTSPNLGEELDRRTAPKVGTRHAVSDDPKGQNRHNIQPVGRTNTACRVPTIESVRSTRALSMTKTTTDSTQTLRITLRPDTVFVPYMTHIRSDTIVAPCPTTQAKLTTARWQIALLLIIIVATIIFTLKDRMTG